MNKISVPLVQRDAKHIWHPCSQMKDYETFPPLVISGADGAYLHLENGTRIIDAISSWWSKALGHQHPRLKAALLRQAECFEHVILANTTNATIVALGEQLAMLSPTLNKAFFASDGSCAIEIAIKMSVHAHQIAGQPQRTRLLALQNAYHGETILNLSISDVGVYREAYQALLIPAQFITHVPYVSGRADPLWDDCAASWLVVEQQLQQLEPSTIAALIVEPILQGAGQMQIYSQDFLRRLRHWTQQHGIHLIADEIMTGIGRTGRALACQHAHIEADFLCLGKALTSGWLPLSVTLTSQKIYDYFYDDYSTGKAFLHSHTFSGNALAAAVAVECLTVMQEENIYAKVAENEAFLLQLMQGVADKTQRLTNVRGIGAMVAADLVPDYPQQRLGYAVYQKAVALGALLRPLGNTIYWLPPLNTPRATLEALQEITIKAIMASNPA